jgi:hypothetical protein
MDEHVWLGWAAHLWWWQRWWWRRMEGLLGVLLLYRGVPQLGCREQELAERCQEVLGLNHD